MQFYRGMDIGTAKLSLDERRGVAHHLIDNLAITDESTAAEYQLLARPLIQELQQRGVIPILAGGSMLYIASVLNDFEFPGTDPDLRAELEARVEELGSVALHRELAELDPVAASRVDALNPRRVVRAIEIVKITGKPFAAALPETPVEWQPSLQLGLNGERAHLVARLAKRVEKMWQLGLVAEVQGLIDAGLREARTASRAIGYAQALAQLDGQFSEAEAIAATTQLTQQYSRRQMSWFRRDQRIQWLDFESNRVAEDAIALAERWLES